MNETLRDEDPLLGKLPTPQPGDDLVAVLPAASKRAVGVVRRVDTPLDSPVSLWRASTLESLQLRHEPHCSSRDIAEVLDAWLDSPEPAVSEAGGDRARSVRIPVITTQAIIPLIERGFAPSTATLARRLSSPPLRPIHRTEVLVRPAIENDRHRMRELMRELVSTEIPFGAVRERTATLSDTYADEAVSLDPGWAVVAELRGEVIGWANIAPPELSTWAADSVSTRPAAYLGVAIVSRAFRAGGVGHALVSDLHAHAASAGVDTVLLDASAQNPWSMPFWQREGYRPLWTTWQRRQPQGL